VATTYWRAKIVLDAVDVSSRITGTVEVEAEESAEAVANFLLTAVAGAIDLDGMRGDSVAIDYEETTEAGALLNAWRLFTGIVDRADYDPNNKTINVRCRDDLKNRLRIMTRAAIDSLIAGSKWSEDLFSDQADNWEYAEQRLSTIASALDTEPDGDIVLTAWAAKGSPDITLTSASVVDETPAVELTPVESLINRTVITFTYRHERRYQREVSDGWDYGRTLCDHLLSPVALPTREMAHRAAEGVSGWLLQRISFTPVFASATTTCGGQDIVWTNNQPGLIIAWGASWVRRWTQTVEEVLTLDLQATSSVASYGERRSDAEESSQTETDSTEWEGAAGGDAPGSFVSGGDGEDDGSFGSHINHVAPTGMSLNSWNDYIQDMVDETARAAAIETILAREATNIHAAHRANTVETQTPLNALITRQSTVRVSTTTVTAKGKVRQVVHSMDTSSGLALTTVRVAISRSGGVPAATALTAPARQAYSPDAPSQKGEIQASGNQFGGKLISPPFDEELSGFASNYYVVPTGEPVFSGSDPTTGELIQPGFNAASAVEPGSPVYPVRFRIDADAIEDEVRDLATVTATNVFVVAPPNDEFTMTA